MTGLQKLYLPKLPEGKPRKFATPEELRDKFIAYFAKCAETMTPPSVVGMANFCETTATTFYEYETKDHFEDYRHYITIAKQVIEESYVNGMLTEEYNVRGVQMLLRSKFNYKDTRHVETDNRNQNVYSSEEIKKLSTEELELLVKIHEKDEPL